MSLTDPEKNKPARYDAVDIVKLLLSITIVMRHTKLPTCLPKAMRPPFNTLLIRPAVPFFFIASGYFLYKNVQKRGSDAACGKYVLRMLRPLVLFESISVLMYVAFRLYKGHAPANILRSCLREIFFYPRGSMWFLQACIIGCLLLYPFYRNKVHPAIAALLAFPLFVFGLLCNNYRFAAEALGLGPLVDGFMKRCISARNGPFYAFFFLALGGAVAAWGLVERLSGRQAVILLALSTALLYSEEQFLSGRLRIDDRSLYFSQILAVPLLFISLCHVRRSFSCSALCRKYSTGIYYLQKIILYAVSCCYTILGMELTPPTAFVLVLLLCVLICTIAYQFPQTEKLLS